jgi:hypothetical protein
VFAGSRGKGNQPAGEKVYYDRAAVLAQLGVFHDPQSVRGRINAVLVDAFRHLIAIRRDRHEQVCAAKGNPNTCVRARLFYLRLLRHRGDARCPIYVLPGSLKDYVEFLLYGRLVVDPCEAITCREIGERVGGPGIADVA